MLVHCGPSFDGQFVIVKVQQAFHFYHQVIFGIFSKMFMCSGKKMVMNLAFTNVTAPFLTSYFFSLPLNVALKRQAICPAMCF